MFKNLLHKHLNKTKYLISCNVHKIQSQKIVRKSNFSNSENISEVEELNKLIKKSSIKQINSGLSNFSLDVLKDVKGFYGIKNNKPNEEDVVLRKNLKKLSNAERVTIGKDDDISKYNIMIHPQEETDYILDAVFKNGTNEQFFKKLDKIYKAVENEDYNKQNYLSNIGDIEFENKDLSDIEEEIEKTNADSLFLNEIDKKTPKKVKTIEEFINTASKVPVITKESVNKSIEVNKSIISNKKEIVQEFNIKPYQIGEIKIESFDFIDSKSLNPGVNDVPRISNFINIENPIEEYNKTAIIKTSKTNSSAGIFKSLKTSPMRESFIQHVFLNKNFSNFHLILSKVNETLFYLKEFLNIKTKQTYFKKSKIENVQASLISNYEIKTLGDKFLIKLHKVNLFEFDRRRMEIICQKILHGNSYDISIVYNAQKIKSKEGLGAFIIFVGEYHIGTITLNLGLVNNINEINFFSSLFSLILVELIQIGCENSKRLMNFNLIFAKTFNIEQKIALNSKNVIIEILSNLIDGKINKFNTKSWSNNFEEAFDDEGKVKNNYLPVSKLPNLKILNHPSLMKTHFRDYFSSAAKLEPGSICFKL
jgi:hypothetical protein